jgi:hypothetical protein
MKYVRFQTRSGLGIYQLLDRLESNRRLRPRDRVRLFFLSFWAQSLAAPPPEVYVNGGHGYIATWFKSEGKDYRGWVEQIATLARKYGYKIRVLRTRDPGEIVYEDEWQVVARNDGVRAIVTTPASHRAKSVRRARRDRTTIRRGE